MYLPTTTGSFASPSPAPDKKKTSSSTMESNLFKFWDDRPPKRGKVKGETVKCTSRGIEKENTYIMAGEGATTGQ